jgi:hypothetical protein
MRDILRFDPQKWIPESPLNMTSRLGLTKRAQGRPHRWSLGAGNNAAETSS